MKMLDRMIAIYGLEAEPVIEFAKLIDSAIFTKETLLSIVEAHEAAVYEDEEIC